MVLADPVSDDLDWFGDLGIRLYLPSGNFPDRNTRGAGQRISDLLATYGINIPITWLDYLDRKRQEYFSSLTGSADASLPFAEVAIGSSGVLGYSGEQEVARLLSDYKGRLRQKGMQKTTA